MNKLFTIYFPIVYTFLIRDLCNVTVMCSATILQLSAAVGATRYRQGDKWRCAVSLAATKCYVKTFPVTEQNMVPEVGSCQNIDCV